MHAPSLPYLQRHQGELATYVANVTRSAEARFGPGFFGLWDQQVAPAPDATLVDLGVGTGLLLERLRERMPEARLIGVELHPEILDALAPLAARARIELVAADLGAPLPLPPGSADCVTSVLSFHELPYPPALLSAAALLLRPGGTLLLHDIVKWPLSTYFTERTLSPEELQHFREHCLFTPDDLAWLMGQAGFVDVRCTVHDNGRFATLVGRRG